MDSIATESKSVLICEKAAKLAMRGQTHTLPCSPRENAAPLSHWVRSPNAPRAIASKAHNLIHPARSAIISDNISYQTFSHHDIQAPIP